MGYPYPKFCLCAFLGPYEGFSLMRCALGALGLSRLRASYPGTGK